MKKNSTVKSHGKRLGQKNDQGKPFVTKFLRQFPDAIKYVSKVSEYGHKKYGKEEDEEMWDNWKHVPNAKERYEQAMGRHILDTIDKESGFKSIAMVAWNALARLQLELDEINRNTAKNKS